MDQCVTVRLYQGGNKTVCRLEEQLDKDAVRHQFYSTETANVSPVQLLKCFGNFAIGEQVLRTVKYADDLVLVPTGHY
jgi:hypothetical protein